MKELNYKSIFQKKNEIKQKLLKVNKELTNDSGIYVFTREENGFKFAYIGQAFNILDRLISHLQGFEQWIDLSIRKHGLFSENNPSGWNVIGITAEKKELNNLETILIKQYADAGFQLRNKTSGSQGEGKAGISGNKQTRGYQEGVRNGYIKARKEIAKLFEKNLYFAIQKDTINAHKAFNKFEEFLRGEN